MHQAAETSEAKTEAKTEAQAQAKVQEEGPTPLRLVRSSANNSAARTSGLLSSFA